MNGKKIRQLTEYEIKRIAAGEVVERPAHIVKELVENSIDAGSTSIIISVKNGGKEEIIVQDNGSGISPNDIILAVSPHATSKLQDINFFEYGINTFGFRGEALSSIATISHFTIISRTNNSSIGTKLVVEYGKILPPDNVSASEGTIIIVKDIFATSPVRKKFLKSREYEWTLLYTMLTSIAFVHHNINFVIKHDEKHIATWKATENIIKRAKNLIEIIDDKGIIPCSFSDNSLLLEGMITTPEITHYDRSKIFFAVNNRSIRNYKIIQTIVKAYRGDAFNRFPITFLSLKIPSEEVDVNIHPKKEEVAFLHQNQIEKCITETINYTLMTYTKKIFSPQITFENTQRFEKNNKNDEKIVETAINNQKINHQPKNFFKKESSYALSINKESVKKKIPFITEIIFDEKSIKKTKKFVGVFAKTYLIFMNDSDTNNDEELLLIDQHALHERIITEELKRGIIGSSPQSLISPLSFTLDPHILSMIEKQKSLLHIIGIAIDLIPPFTLVVRGLIPYFQNDSLLSTIISIAEEGEKTYIEKNSAFLLDHCLGNIACKKAIRAGDTLAPSQMELLLLHALDNENNAWCPHGRPTYQVITIESIEKLFKRK